MKLTNEEKCVYCREYGNLPCEECDKKLEAKKAMSKTKKTKFTKVAVSENPPDEGSVQIFLTEGGLRKLILYRAKWFQEERYSLYKYYLVESPDREEEMIEMLEKVVKILDVNCHKGCDHKSWNDFQNGDGDDVGVEIQIFIDRAKTLLQSLKQPLFSNEAKSN